MKKHWLISGMECTPNSQSDGWSASQLVNLLVSSLRARSYIRMMQSGCQPVSELPVQLVGRLASWLVCQLVS